MFDSGILRRLCQANLSSMWNRGSKTVAFASLARSDKKITECGNHIRRGGSNNLMNELITFIWIRHDFDSKPMACRSTNTAIFFCLEQL